MRVLTLNVCGIRASEKKGLFAWLKKQKSDYICLQEVRAQEDQIDDKFTGDRSAHDAKMSRRT